MTLRLQNLMLAMLLALTTLFVGLGTLSQNPTSGGYQLFERVASEHQPGIQLVLLETFDYHAKTASECCIAPNRTLPEGYREIQPVGAQVNVPNDYRKFQNDNGDVIYQDARGNTYNSIDELPTPTGQFSGNYEPNPKHDRPGGNVSPQPTNGEAVLADSVPLGGNSTGRIGYDNSTGEIVVFQNHQSTSYHGYVPSSWGDLRQAEKNALIRAGLFTPRGRPVR